MRVAVKQRVADVLLKYPDGRHVQDLALEVNIQPMKLAAILKVLATRHCFREGMYNLFSSKIYLFKSDLLELPSDPRRFCK